MINKGKLLIIFTIIIILGGCGRKGDLLPPPNLTSTLSSNSVMDSK